MMWINRPSFRKTTRSQDLLGALRRPNRRHRGIGFELLETRRLLTTITVTATSNYRENGVLLRNAVNFVDQDTTSTAGDPDVIAISAGLFQIDNGTTESPLTITNNVKIEGAGTSDSGTEISADDLGRDFVIETGSGQVVTLQDMQVKFGEAQQGGGFYINGGGDVFLQSMDIHSNLAEGTVTGVAQGGAIFSTGGGDLQLDSDDLSSDMAQGGYGGGVAQGGSIFAEDTAVIIADTTFNTETAFGGNAGTTTSSLGTSGGEADGGAIFANYGSTLLVLNTDFESDFVVGGAGGSGANDGGNGGNAAGGAIQLDGSPFNTGSATITQDTFNGDYAQGGPAASGTDSGGAGGSAIGGAIKASFPTTSLEGDYFTGDLTDGGNGGSGNVGGNGGPGQGGAIDLVAGSLYDHQDLYIGNTSSSGQGGTGGSQGGSNGTAQGGAFYLAGSGASVTNSIFTKNNALSSPLLLDNGFQGANATGPGGTGGNGGTSEGGAIDLATGNLTIVGASFVHNSAWASNGGLGFSGSGVQDDVDGGNGGNGGEADGGAISSGSVGTISIATTQFGGNTVWGGGGGTGGDGDPAGGSGDDGGNGGNGGIGGGGYGGALSLNNSTVVESNSISILTSNFTSNAAGSGTGGQGGNGALGSDGSSDGSNPDATFHGGDGGNGGDGGSGGSAQGGAIWSNSPSLFLDQDAIANNTAAAGFGGNGGLGGPGNYATSYSLGLTFLFGTPDTYGGSGGAGGSGGNAGSALGGGIALARGAGFIEDTSILGNTAQAGFGGDGLQGGNGAQGVQGDVDGSGGNGGSGGIGGTAAGGGGYVAPGSNITYLSMTIATNQILGGAGGAGGMGGGPAGTPVGLFPSRQVNYLSSLQSVQSADEVGIGNVITTFINRAISIKYAVGNGQTNFGGEEDEFSLDEAAGDVTEAATEASDVVGDITDFLVDLDALVETVGVSLELLPFTIITGAIAVYMVAADVAAGVAAIVAEIQGDNAGATFAHISTTLLGPTDYNTHFAYNLGDLFETGEGDGGAGSPGSKGSDGANGSVQGGGLDNAGVTSIEDTIIAGNVASTRSLSVSGFGFSQEWNSEGLPTSSPMVVLNTQSQTSTDDLASSGTLNSFKHNLIGIDSGVAGLNGEDLTGTVTSPLNPGLTVAALAPGDSTVVTAYYPGPIAVNQDPNPVLLSTYDQLGNPRLVGGAVDIGAVELPLAASFVGGPDEDAAENIGTQSYPGWATKISDLSGGTPPSDNLGFVVTGDSDPGLFSTVPSVSSDGTLTFTPATGQTGVAQITIVLQDNAGVSNPYTFSITIVPVTPPKLTPIGNIQAMENSSYAFADAQVGDLNPYDPSVRVSATSSNTTLIPSVGSLYESNPNGLDGQVALTMMIAPGQVGTSIITITVSNSLGSSTENFTVNVLAPVYVPTLAPISSVSVSEDSTGDSVSLSGISSGPGNGDPHVNLTVTSNNPSLILDPTIVYDGSSSQGTLVFTPTVGQFGTATISITATNDDSPTSSFTRNFTVTVFHINSAPTIDPVAPITIAEGSDPVFVSLTGITDGLADTGQTITVTATSSNPTLIRNPTRSYVSPNNFGALAFVPIAGQYGTATITITVQDNGGTAYGGVNTKTESFLVTVTPVQVSVGSVSVQVGSEGAMPLLTASDGLRLLPAERNTDLPWMNLDQFQITLSGPQALSALDVKITSAIGANYGPMTITGSGEDYTITLAKPVSAADRLTITIGNAGIATFTREIDILPGDVNDDGIVNSQDAVLVRDAYLGIGNVLIPLIFLDVDGSGTVDLTDYTLVHNRAGTHLP